MMLSGTLPGIQVIWSPTLSDPSGSRPLPDRTEPWAMWLSGADQDPWGDLHVRASENRLVSSELDGMQGA